MCDFFFGCSTAFNIVIIIQVQIPVLYRALGERGYCRLAVDIVAWSATNLMGLCLTQSQVEEFKYSIDWVTGKLLLQTCNEFLDLTAGQSQQPVPCHSLAKVLAVKGTRAPMQMRFPIVTPLMPVFVSYSKLDLFSQRQTHYVCLSKAPQELQPSEAWPSLPSVDSPHHTVP